MANLLGTSNFDAIIVGCGPAGIFCALELSEKNPSLKILMVDKGPDIPARLSCPVRQGRPCIRCCNPCKMSCGWGGVGAFSDGKLNVSAEIGGWLGQYRKPEEITEITEYVDSLFVKFEAPGKVYGTDSDKIEEIERNASLAGLRFVPYRVRHMGTDNCAKVLQNIESYLSPRVNIKLGTTVEALLSDEKGVQGIVTDQGEIRSRYVIVCPGRAGSEWLETEMKRMRVKVYQNPVDLGLRVEVSAEVMKPLTDVLYEPKFMYTSKTFDDDVRMFCVCPHGRVITEFADGITTVNGESFASKKTKNTNFALLVSTRFTEPFKRPPKYAKSIALLANLIGGGAIIQRLKDLKNGKRSTEEKIARNAVVPTLKNATPGDLSFVLPHRYLVSIVEMLQALDRIAPGVYADQTLLYGVETKLYSTRPEVTSDLEVAGVRNLYVAGDGAGLTRSLMQASVSGVICARAILQREKPSNPASILETT